MFFNFEPYIFSLSKEENVDFLTKNMAFFDSLEYLLKCNYHQFWCTIFFEPSAAVSLRSFILNPIPPYQMIHLEEEYANLYHSVFRMFLLVYQRLITFKVSEVSIFRTIFFHDHPITQTFKTTSVNYPEYPALI